MDQTNIFTCRGISMSIPADRIRHSKIATAARWSGQCNAAELLVQVVAAEWASGSRGGRRLGAQLGGCGGLHGREAYNTKPAVTNRLCRLFESLADKSSELAEPSKLSQQATATGTTVV